MEDREQLSQLQSKILHSLAALSCDLETLTWNENAFGSFRKHVIQYCFRLRRPKRPWHVDLLSARFLNRDIRSFQALGDDYGISRERVRQIVQLYRIEEAELLEAVHEVTTKAQLAGVCKAEIEIIVTISRDVLGLKDVGLKFNQMNCNLVRSLTKRYLQLNCEKCLEFCRLKELVHYISNKVNCALSMEFIERLVCKLFPVDNSSRTKRVFPDENTCKVIQALESEQELWSIKELADCLEIKRDRVVMVLETNQIKLGKRGKRWGLLKNVWNGQSIFSSVCVDAYELTRIFDEISLDLRRNRIFSLTAKGLVRRIREHFSLLELHLHLDVTDTDLLKVALHFGHDFRARASIRCFDPSSVILVVDLSGSIKTAKQQDEEYWQDVILAQIGQPCTHEEFNAMLHEHYQDERQTSIHSFEYCSRYDKVIRDEPWVIDLDYSCSIVIPAGWEPGESSVDATSAAKEVLQRPAIRALVKKKVYSRLSKFSKPHSEWLMRIAFDE